MMSLGSDATCVQGGLECLMWGRALIGEPYFPARAQDSRNADRKIQPRIKPHAINLGPRNCGTFVAAEPDQLIIAEMEAGRGIAPQIPNCGQGKDANEPHQPRGRVDQKNQCDQEEPDRKNRAERRAVPTFAAKGEPLSGHPSRPAWTR